MKVTNSDINDPLSHAPEGKIGRLNLSTWRIKNRARLLRLMIWVRYTPTARLKYWVDLMPVIFEGAIWYINQTPK